MEEAVNEQLLKYRIAVLAGDPDSMEKGEELAGKLDLPLIDNREHACETEYALFLVRDRKGLSLQDQLSVNHGASPGDIIHIHVLRKIQYTVAHK